MGHRLWSTDDGHSWHAVNVTTGQEGAYSATLAWQDGGNSVAYTRERPNVLLVAVPGGVGTEPVALFTGVVPSGSTETTAPAHSCAGHAGGYSYTHSQLINHSWL